MPDVILPRGTSDAVLDRALLNLNLAVDRYAVSEDVEELENIEEIYADAEKIFNDEELSTDEKIGEIFEKLDFLDRKALEFRENGKETLATKCEVTSDEI